MGYQMAVRFGTCRKCSIIKCPNMIIAMSRSVLIFLQEADPLAFFLLENVKSISEEAFEIFEPYFEGISTLLFKTTLNVH